jgi:hypothetical protein
MQGMWGRGLQQKIKAMGAAKARAVPTIYMLGYLMGYLLGCLLCPVAAQSAARRRRPGPARSSARRRRAGPAPLRPPRPRRAYSLMSSCATWLCCASSLVTRHRKSACWRVPICAANASS